MSGSSESYEKKMEKPPSISSFLNFRLITTNDLLAVEYIHYKLFPVRYDSTFYKKICSESDATVSNSVDNECQYDYENFCGDNSYCTLRNWKDEQLIGIGVFYNCKGIRNYKQGSNNQCEELVQDTRGFKCQDSEFDTKNQNLHDQNVENYEQKASHKLSDLLLVGDEYLIGIVTFLINFSGDNALVSGKSEYQDLFNYYQKIIKQSDTNANKCRLINTNLVTTDLYKILQDCLYFNAELIDKLSRLLYNKSLESVYILTAGVIESFRCMGIGTSLILFVQLLFHRLCYNSVLALENDTLIWVSTGKFKEMKQKIPPFIYLHVIDYNDAALRVYNKANLVKIATIKNYYSIGSTNYDAHMLGCYIEMY